jgi:hypothetical protein
VRTFLFTLLFTLVIDVGEAALRGPVWSDMSYVSSRIVWSSVAIAALISPKRWDERLAAWFFLVSALAFALAERGTFSG